MRGHRSFGKGLSIHLVTLCLVACVGGCRQELRPGDFYGDSGFLQARLDSVSILAHKPIRMDVSRFRQSGQTQEVLLDDIRLRLPSQWNVREVETDSDMGESRFWLEVREGRISQRGRVIYELNLPHEDLCYYPKSWLRKLAYYVKDPESLFKRYANDFELFARAFEAVPTDLEGMRGQEHRETCGFLVVKADRLAFCREPIMRIDLPELHAFVTAYHTASGDMTETVAAEVFDSSGKYRGTLVFGFRSRGKALSALDVLLRLLGNAAFTEK